MLNNRLKFLLTYSGISTIVGALGLILGLISPFIDDWNKLISLKWVILMFYILFIIILILIKVLFDINEDIKTKKVNYIKVIRYIEDLNIFICSKNDFFGYNASVSIFYLDDNFEIELGKGYVYNIQEKFIQIKLLEMTEEFKRYNLLAIEKIKRNDASIINKIIVKSYIKYNS